MTISIFVNVLTPVFTIVAVGYLAAPRLGVGGRSVQDRLLHTSLAFIFNLFSAVSLSLAVRMSLHRRHFRLRIGGHAQRPLMGHRGRGMAFICFLAAFGNAGTGLPIIQFAGRRGCCPPQSIPQRLRLHHGVMAAAWDRGLRRPSTRSQRPPSPYRGRWSMAWTGPCPLLDCSIDCRRPPPVMLLTLACSCGIHRPLQR